MMRNKISIWGYGQKKKNYKEYKYEYDRGEVIWENVGWVWENECNYLRNIW